MELLQFQITATNIRILVNINNVRYSVSTELKKPVYPLLNIPHLKCVATLPCEISHVQKTPSSRSVCSNCSV